MRWKSQLQKRNPDLLLRAQKPRSNVGQVGHVSPTPWVTSQEVEITRRARRRLAGSGWGAGATNLRTATLAMVRSTSEYCAPVCCRSAHARLIDPSINDALRIVNGCLMCPTPAENIPILAGIQPAELCRKGSHTVSNTPCCGAWTTAPLSAHPSIECGCTASQIRTPICTRRLTTHLTATKEQNAYGALSGSPMECGVGGQPHKTPHLRSRHRHPSQRSDAPKKSLGPA